MNKRLLISFLLLGILLPLESSNSQFLKPEREKSPLEVSVSRFPTLQADSVQVDIYTRISLDNLVFVSHGEDFKAAYELSIFAIDKDGIVHDTRIWREEVVKTHYRETQSEELYHIANTTFILPPGEYRIVVNLVDQDNRQRYDASEEIEIAEYPPDRLVIGDIILLSESQKTPGQPNLITLYFGNKISNAVDTFYFHIVLRNPIVEISKAVLEYTVEEEDETPVDTSRRTLNLDRAISAHTIPIATSRLKEREYTLKLRVRVDSLEVEKSAPVHITWVGLTALIDDLDQAIDQARYVATRRQLQKIRSASGEAKRKAFLEFWRALDPIPDTPRNELMDEYYSRVAYANAHFRSFRPGWETDLGMVYIIYGQPDDIERHPFDMNNKPYQVWFYYAKGWRFVFVDVNMFGDYRLVTPLYPSRSF